MAIRDSILKPILRTFEQLNQSEVDWQSKKKDVQMTMQKVRAVSKNDKVRDMAAYLMDAIGQRTEEQDPAQ